MVEMAVRVLDWGCSFSGGRTRKKIAKKIIPKVDTKRNV
jgi:hypothetical protein